MCSTHNKASLLCTYIAIKVCTKIIIPLVTTQNEHYWAHDQIYWRVRTAEPSCSYTQRKKLIYSTALSDLRTDKALTASIPGSSRYRTCIRARMPAREGRASKTLACACYGNTYYTRPHNLMKSRPRTTGMDPEEILKALYNPNKWASSQINLSSLCLYQSLGP